MISPRKLKELYERGENISATMRNELGIKDNTQEIIEISYDLQTGSYINAMKNEDMLKHKDEYTSEIAKIIQSLCDPSSILEAGVGEATTFSGVIKKSENKIRGYGFDLSWSRVAYAKKYLKYQNVDNIALCTGDLFDIPFADNSIDIVYTSHSIEPNRGGEKRILSELYRVARKYVILLEPAYEFANKETRSRMESHGYCRGLKETAESLGFDVVKNELFPFVANPMNPTAITIISKQCNMKAPMEVFVCPQFKTPLKEIDSVMYSPEALVAYPIIGGIPCLRIDNGVLASKLEEVALYS
jgi:ubiquinone/menaquinone biosynthesis C-methylase UbiE/uncharacterized protein YbaR (Trm112 family)